MGGTTKNVHYNSSQVTPPCQARRSSADERGGDDTNFMLHSIRAGLAGRQVVVQVGGSRFRMYGNEICAACAKGGEDGIFRAP